MQGWTLSEAKQRCQVTEIGPLLEQGQLAGYARPAGRESDLVAIPKSAWADIEIADEAGTCLVHRPSRAEFLNLRIYPVLHAPDAPELLHDMGLGEVFMTSILRDPEVAALGRRVMASEGHRDVFLEGMAPGGITQWHWYADWDAKNMADAFSYQLVSFWEKRAPPPSAAIVSAATALADRMAALRALLSTGKVSALGTHRLSGRVDAILRGQWLRTSQTIDVANGDLCELDSSKWIPTWTGVILESPKPASSLEERFHQITEGNPKTRSSSSAAELQCTAWLKHLMHLYPDRRHWSKRTLFEEAGKWWERLSEAGFNRAWDQAMMDEAGEIWSKAGAPEKGTPPMIPPPRNSKPIISEAIISERK